VDALIAALEELTAERELRRLEQPESPAVLAEEQAA
jgi:hypothetical protein